MSMTLYNVNNGINQFMEGYIRSENIKFRPYELTFKNNLIIDVKTVDTNINQEYPNMSKIYETSKFRIDIDSGSFCKNEIICLMGENGTGKTTFINLLIDL